MDMNPNATPADTDAEAQLDAALATSNDPDPEAPVEVKPTEEAPAETPAEAPAEEKPPVVEPIPEAPTVEELAHQAQVRKAGIPLPLFLAVVLLALAGIAVGIYGMMSASSNDTKIGDLEKQLADTKAKLAAAEDAGLIRKCGPEDDPADFTVKEPTEEQIQQMIESTREANGYDTWTTGEVTKIAVNETYTILYVNYVEKNTDNYETKLGLIMKYEDGKWTFDLPGFSGTAGDIMSEYGLSYFSHPDEDTDE